MAIYTFKINKFFSLFLLFIMISCNSLFSVRDADEPNIVSGNIFNLTPKDVFNNLEKAMLNSHINDYSSLFSDSLKQGVKYSFIPEGDFIFDFKYWDNKSEEKFAQNLFNNYFFSKFSLTGVEFDNLSDIENDSLSIEFSYHGLLLNSSNDSLIVTGDSQVTIKKIDTFWYITRWYEEEEYSDNENFTSLKLMF